jgi:cell division protein FtsZ
MVSHFAKRFQEEKKDINKNIKLIAINTDLQALSTMDNKNITLIQIGKKTATGLGAGMDPEIGRKSAIEDYEDIKNALL